MGFRGSITGAIIAALVVAGCGGGSSDANQGEADKTGNSATTAAGNTNPNKFPVSANKIPTFGETADEDEREAASEVLEENLRARADGDWQTQCDTLSPEAVEDVAEIAKIQNIEGGGCAKELEARAEPLQQTKGLRAYDLSGSIDELRAEGDLGYAIYHGKGGQEYAMPMERVDGEWRVGAVLEEQL